MPEPVTAIRNLGPAMARSLAAAGIDDAETLRALGADAAYARLLAAGDRPHFIAYYAIVMGLQGRPWADCTASEKLGLRRRFDAIKAGLSAAPVPDADAPSAAASRRPRRAEAVLLDPGTLNELGRIRMDAALAEIGVIERRRAQPTSSSPEKK
ncbi:MAG: TfoX/Sxy family DNA transformation protein [Mangrovicoccus sp.]|nr:TfoX/Sxy family DNA transformation protein [Mangrovicoccus sp.]